MSVTALAACNGELYLDSQISLTDFDPADRDNGDPIDNTDGNGDPIDNGDGFGDQDIDLGDSPFGGDGDGDCPECCGFGGVCPDGQQCYVGVCGPACATALCGENQLCCTGETSECCDATIDNTCGQDHCRKACPANNVHCGAKDDLCCDTGAGLTCGTDLTCVTACGATDGPLCGNDPVSGAPGVCCDGKGTADPNDDDVCLFSQCIPRGGHCKTFVDCPNGQYCETTIHDPGFPDDGVCLPNTFPDDVPQCQGGDVSNLFSPTTEWAWVGIEIVADANPWNAGDLVRPCTNNTDTHCYREPCTNFTDGTNCFRSVETTPITHDLDGDTFPEVTFKAYADSTYGGNNLLVIADGRADSALPEDPAQPVNQTHRTKRVVWGETRGHVAVGDLDGGTTLEVVAAHANGAGTDNGVIAYNPFSKANPTGTATANVLMWQYNGGYANNSFTAGAPSLNDMNDDGVPEVVIGPVIVDGLTGALILDLSSGATTPFGNSNPGGCGGNGATKGTADCFDITTVADVNNDKIPELLTGNQAISITYDGTWHSSVLWTVAHDALVTANETTFNTLGAGFPGVGDFVDNSQPPYCDGATGIACSSAVNTPEVAVVYNGGVFIVSGATGQVLRTPIPCAPTSPTTPNNACIGIFTQAACTGTSGCAWNNAELYVRPLNDRGGPPNIADFDGDGQDEVSFAGSGCMVVIDPQCAVGSSYINAGSTADARDGVALIPRSGCSLARPATGTVRTCTIGMNGGYPTTQEWGMSWMYQTQDASSAVTGTSVFDFQGDLKAEVLYNDECFFRVFEGSDASILYERPNSHRTATEYPTVVDVDGDGNSEIVVVSTGDQAVARDRCGNPTRAGHVDCDGKDQTACAAAAASCSYVNGTCIPTAAHSESVCQQLGAAAASSCTGQSTQSACQAVKISGVSLCNWDSSKSPKCQLGNPCNSGGSGCQNVSGVCAPFAYYRDVDAKYKSSACFCTDHTTQADCNASRGCTWDGTNSVCGLVGAAGTYCSQTGGSATTRDQCIAKNKDCIWSGYASATGSCVQHPRDQDYICQHATWGVTSFGDTSNKWVRTLPYWHEHDYHITNTDRDGHAVPDFDICYDNRTDGDLNEIASCKAHTTKQTCQADTNCGWGARNFDPNTYNNFRQNVPGFVPLNEGDLEVTELVADVRACPPTITLIATVLNHGRAGVLEGVPVGFYRMTNSESPSVTAGRTDELGGSYVLTTVPLLPGQTTHVEITFSVTEVPINLAYRAIVNPALVATGSSTTPECNNNNNSADVSNVDCINPGT